MDQQLSIGIDVGLFRKIVWVYLFSTMGGSLKAAGFGDGWEKPSPRYA